MHEPTNEELIADLPATMRLMAEGLGHYLRLALAGYIYTNPEHAARMAELLNSNDERAELHAWLCNGTFDISVSIRPRDAVAPHSIVATRVDLPPIAQPH